MLERQGMPREGKAILKKPDTGNRLADAQRRLVTETMSYAGAHLRQARGPKTLTNVLDALMAQRGFGRTMAASELERVWVRELGQPKAVMTKLGDIRRGVLNVTVGNSCLLEELSQFRKPSLLKALRATSGGTRLTDIRFRQGRIDD
ncbi:MAG: DUF721 domain-containing protein [Planctomycetota bacterium]|nr:MAG: DUF721 domain-containing protein [Planctomycetota bacterium]RLT13585.1 MAG: DUF721 domain-containing protein [Planctomycetota bacterium]